MSGSLSGLGGQINAAYRRDVEHPADAATLQYWEQMISTGQRSLSDVEGYLQTTPEARADAQAVQQLYQSELGRAASGSEVADRETDLSNGQTMAGLHGSLSATGEAVADIQALYQTVLGRAATGQEVADRQADLAGGQSLAGLRGSLSQTGEAAGDIAYQVSTELGRTASAGDISYWEGRLSADISQAGIRSAYANSAEAQAQIQDLYQTVLGRAAGPAELSQRQADLNGGQSLQGLRAIFAGSDEATAQIGSLYQQVLGRAADPAGLAAACASLAAGGSLSTLRAGLAHSAEAAGDIAFRVSTELGRAAGAGDVAFWADRLATNTSLSALQAAYAGSGEAANAVQGLYQAVLGRAASATELGQRQADLTGGASMDDLRRSLVRSDEAVGDIQALYVQVLGRTAGDGEVLDRQGDLIGGQSLAGLRASVAGSAEAAGDIRAVFQAVLGRAADNTEVAAWQQALGGGSGWTLALVGPSLVTSAVNGFYQGLFGRDATAAEVSGFEGALAAGQSLSSQFAGLRPVFATSASETGTINQFYDGIVGRDATAGELSAIEGALSAGQSLSDIESSLTPAVAKAVEGLYQQDLGRRAAWPELSFWEGQLQAGQPMAAVSAAIADSAESVQHIQALWQQDFGRYASLDEVQGWQAAEASGVAPGSKFTVSTPAGQVLAVADARTIVAEAGAYVTLSGGLTPTLTAPDGTALGFHDGSEFAAYALGMAARSGQATPAMLGTYDLTQSWLGQVGQAFIQAAANLQARAQADAAAGNVQQAYAEGLGAQLAMKVQALPPGQRQAQSLTAMLGQYSVSVTIAGDASDPAGLGGFNYLVTDTDPGRTALLAKAQQEAAAGDAAGAAGNQLLAALDTAQARVDVGYAALPAGARTDRMLAVAQQFVDAGQAAAGQGNWNLVQTLETAADVSLRIAAEPEGQRSALTERFVHKGVKHDITVDPNAADPFASFKDHSKGEDAVGAIVEGVAGVVLNVLAVIPSPLQAVTIPAAVAWDTAQAGQSFAEGNVLGGFLGLASAAGVGLSELQAFAQAAGASGLADVASSAGNALKFTNSIASSLGFTATAAGSATQALGQTILSGAALVGGASGIAQSAGSGDPLGIAAGALEVAAAVAGGLVSTHELGGSAAEVAGKLAAGAGLASVAVSSADAFAHGDLAGGLASSLNALLPLIAQNVAQRSGPAEQPAAPAPPDGYGEDGLPLPVPPIPPDQSTGTLNATDQTQGAGVGAIPGTDYITFTPSQPAIASPVGILGNLVGKLFRVSNILLNVANILFESSPAGVAGQQGTGALPDGVTLPYTQSEGYVTVFTPNASGTLRFSGDPGILLNANGDVAGVRLQVGGDGSLQTLGGVTVGYMSDAAGIRISSPFLDNIFNSIASGSPDAPPATVIGEPARPEPIAPPVTPEGLLPDSPSEGTRSQDLDALAEQVAGNTKDRLSGADSPLDADHLGAAAQEYYKGQPVADPNGNPIISKGTGQPVDHVQEVDAAATGLESDIKKLEDKLVHNNNYVKPRPVGSIADAESLLNKMKELDKFVRNVIPKVPDGARALWSKKG